MKSIEFKAPAGYVAPEGVKEGDVFRELATFKVKPGGTLCLVEIDDKPVGGYKDDDEKGEGVVDSAARQMEAMPNYQANA